MARKPPLPEQGRQLAGVGGDGIVDAGMFPKRLAFEPLHIQQPLPLLGEAHIEGQQFPVGICHHRGRGRRRPMQSPWKGCHGAITGSGGYPWLSRKLMAGCRPQPPVAATVVSIGDGDTLRVDDNGQRLTIRLACIDAPETAQRPQGIQARQTLRALLPIGSEVELRPQTLDKYRRTVAEVYRGGQSINLAMVSQGQTYAYRKYLASCDQAAYLGAEANAERQRLGVWATPGGSERPWDWRQQRRQGSVSNGASSMRWSGFSGQVPSLACEAGYRP